MKLSPEAKKELTQTDALTNLHNNKSKILEMLASDGYKCWLEWSEMQKKAWEIKAVRGETIAEREEARVFFLAFEKFCEMPLFLSELLQEEVSSDGAA